MTAGAVPRLLNLAATVRAWCRGRLWWPRLLLEAYLAYAGVRHLLDSQYASLFAPVNLAIHEAGHVVFSCFGTFLHALGGTLLQLAAPVASFFVFHRARDWFAMSISGVWLATNLYQVAAYVGDARAQVLPLVTLGGGDAQHDWTFLLGELGLLGQDTVLAFLLRALAFALTWASVGAGLWMVACMLRPGPDPDAPPGGTGPGRERR